MNQGHRALALIILLALLGGLFVAYGAEILQPDTPPYGADEIGPDSSAYVGEPIELSGTVVATDPVTIEVGYNDDMTTFHVEDTPTVTIGEELLVTGTLTTESTITAHPDRTITREPWERTYMYLISIFGAIIVALKLGNEWRFDRRHWWFEPRSQTLHSRYRTGGTQDG